MLGQEDRLISIRGPTYSFSQFTPAPQSMSYKFMNKSCLANRHKIWLAQSVYLSFFQREPYSRLFY